MTHRHRTHLGTLFVALALGLVVLPTAIASATVGTMLVAVDTTLTEDHNGPVVITADNVTLDCAGHTITGVGLAASTPGIAMTGRTGVTIKNCTVERFKQDGINVRSSDGNTFSDNTINGIRQGFVFHNSDSNELTGNTVTGAFDWFGYGIFEGSDNNVLRGNSATAVSGVGFMIQHSDNNLFADNTSSNNSGNGFSANIPTKGNTYTGNIANDNTLRGFEDLTSDGTGDAGTDNHYAGNTCLRNTLGGSHPVTLCQDQDMVGLVDPATGMWRLSFTGLHLESFYYGNPGDVPFMGDWDCDGVATPGLFRTSDAFAYLRNSNTQGIADIRFYFGNPSDIPLAGDFNGDGCDTLSIYRPSEARFYIINKLGENEGGLGAAEYAFLFGNMGDKPVVGDWDGDGIDEIGLHRETTGFFYYRNTLTTGIADGQFYFGDPGDRFVSGDWGVVDGIDTPALYRPSNTTFYFRHTLTQGNADYEFVWNGAGADWLPVAGEAALD